MIRIRRATIEDVAYIAEGIYHAFLLEDETLYNQWIRTLKEVCAQEDTHYSYRNTWIAEVDGERVPQQDMSDLNTPSISLSSCA